MIDGKIGTSVPGLIQTSLAPMFLLTAVGTTLSVIDGRLNRIVDRARALEARMAVGSDQSADDVKAEADHFLARAGKLTNAVAFCASTALTVALVVALIFVDLQTKVDLSIAVEAAFTLAVLLYVGALAIYLRDVFEVRTGLGFLHDRLARRGLRRDGRTTDV